MESNVSQQASSSSQEDESLDDQYKMSRQTSVVDDPSTLPTDSDEETYKSANEKSEDEVTMVTTSVSEPTEETRLQVKQEVAGNKKPPSTPAVSSSKIPSNDRDILGWWYQYLNSSLYGKEDENHRAPCPSAKMTSSMRVVQWLEGNNRSSRTVRRKEKGIKERKKFKKEHAVLLKQEEGLKVIKTQQQQQQDSSLRGPLSIRPSFIDFLQKISKGKAEPTLEDLEKEWPPQVEMFKRIITTPPSTEKKEETESEASKPKVDKKSAASAKASKKSKASSGSSKGKKGIKQKTKKSKSLRGSKGKGKKKGSAKKKGSVKKKGSAKMKGSAKKKGSASSKVSKKLGGLKSSKASSGGKKKRKGGKKKKGSVASIGSKKSHGKGKKKGTADVDKEDFAKRAMMRKSFAEAQVRQSVFAENFRKGSRKVSTDGFGRAFSKTLRKVDKTKCNIPAAIHLYYGERADFLTEGELEEIRQRLNRVVLESIKRVDSTKLIEEEGEESVIDLLKSVNVRDLIYVLCKWSDCENIVFS